MVDGVWSTKDGVQAQRGGERGNSNPHIPGNSSQR